MGGERRRYALRRSSFWLTSLGVPFWDIMSRYPERQKVFQVGFTIYDDVTMTGGYDFNQLDSQDDRPILVAMGGSLGHEIAAILKEYPNLPASKFVLQDLEDPIKLAHQMEWLPKDVKKMVNDFWKGQPVKGQSVRASRHWLTKGRSKSILHATSDP